MSTQIRLTQPIHGHRCATSYAPPVTYRLGDLVTNVFETAPAVWRRHVGTVTASDSLTFTISWRGTDKQARYSHDHEPDTLRHATPADEHAAVHHTERAAAADELRRQARAHPHWPADILRALHLRAHQLTGKP